MWSILKWMVEEAVFTRPIYSGKAFEKIKIKDGMVFATIRPNNIPPLEKDESRSGDVSNVRVDIKDLRTTIKDIVKKATGGIDLSEAKIIVSGGRGMKGCRELSTFRGTGTCIRCCSRCFTRCL